MDEWPKQPGWYNVYTKKNRLDEVAQRARDAGFDIQNARIVLRDFEFNETRVSKKSFEEFVKEFGTFYIRDLFDEERLEILNTLDGVLHVEQQDVNIGF